MVLGGGQRRGPGILLGKVPQNRHGDLRGAPVLRHRPSVWSGYSGGPGSTGELDTNYEGKVAAALEELRSGKDFVAVHVEAPDECTHNGDLPGKLQAIEWLDSRVVGPLTQALAEEGTDYRLLILSDHKTLTATRGHDADPVPYLLYDSRKDTGLGLPYCEESGQKGPAYPAGAPVLMKKLFAL